MAFWKQPRKTLLRRALFQVHLWTGIAVGLYMVFISITGSAVVFRRDLMNYKLGNVPAKDAPAVTKVAVSRRRLSPNEVTLIKEGDVLEQRFNPYTGADMGVAHPQSVAVMEWFVDLHDNLLTGETGRKVNAAGGALLCLLCITGIVIWWKASGAWYRGFFVNPLHNWSRVNFDLHAALGFWSLLILFMWGLTGIYFAFPDPFIATVDYLQPAANYEGTRSGDAFIAWMVRMHFGRYGGPAVMFVTGSIMWWKRVLRRWVTEGRTVRGAAFPVQPATEQVE